MASEALLPIETRQRILRTGQGPRPERVAGRTARRHLPLKVLTRRCRRRLQFPQRSRPHARAPIRRAAPHVGAQERPSRTAPCAIWRESTVSTQEAAGFAGQGHRGFPVSLGRRRRVGRLFLVLVGEREHPRWCAREQDEADGPIPGVEERLSLRNSWALLTLQTENIVLLLNEFGIFLSPERGLPLTRPLACALSGAVT